MAHQVTQRDIDLLTYRNRTISIKLELLNARNQVIETLEGECIDAPLSLQSTSDIRRTCALSLFVKDASYVVSENSRIWFDKKIRLSYGFYDNAAGDYRYYPMGVFVITETGYKFDALEKKLDASLVDPMALGTQERGSAIGASKIVVEAGTSIRAAMISVISDLIGWQQYNVCQFTEENGIVPYDLEFNTGAYPYEIMAKLRDLFPGYETFFSTNGTFECQKIPSNMSDEIVIRAEVMDALITEGGIQPKVNFTEMKNATELWGQSLEADRWSETCVSAGNVYRIDIPDITVLDDGKTYGFKTDAASQSGQSVQINSLPPGQIFYKEYQEDGTQIDTPLAVGQMRADTSYVLLYTGGRFYLQGELEIHVIVMEVNHEPDDATKAAYEAKYDCRNIRYVVNPESPFATDRADVGIVMQVFSGGEFDDIYTTELAFDRASYENWKTTRLIETMIVECLMVPWLDINHKIEMTSPLTNTKEQYLVKSIQFNLAQSTMTIEVVRFYPYFPWLS